MYKEQGKKSLDVNVDKSQLLHTNDVATLMEHKHGVKLSPRMILDYVKQGRAGPPDDWRMGHLQAVLLFYRVEQKNLTTRKYRLVKMYEEMKMKKCNPKKF